LGRGGDSSARGEEPKVPRTFAFLHSSEEAVGAVSIQQHNMGTKKPGPELKSTLKEHFSFANYKLSVAQQCYLLS